MKQVNYLFDLEPYTVHPPKERHHRTPISPALRGALARLRRTINAIPDEEWEARRRRLEELQRSVRNI